MNKKKLVIAGLATSLLLGSAFSVLFALAKSEEFNKNISLAKEISNQLDKYQQKYVIKDYSNKDQLIKEGINEVSNYAMKLFNEKKIASYEVNGDSVVINNNCGVTTVFSPSVDGTYGDLKTVLNYTKVIPNQVIYDEQCRVTEGKQPLPPGFTHDGQLIPDVAQKLGEEFEHVSYDPKDLLQSVPLNKEFMQKLGPNQIVIIVGHGTYVEGYHSTLNTGRQFSWEDYQNDPTYREDCKNGLIIDTSGGEAFTTRYIDKYVGDLTNTFIYFGQCESAKDSALANSFLYKGAAALVANTEAISMRYGDIMQYTTVKHLMDKHADGSYLTIKEALQLAKDTYGECDPDLGHSVPTLFGNENYSIDTTINAPVYKENYVYTGEEIEFVKPGIGFHFDSKTPNKGTDAGLYFVDVLLDDGYKWPDGTTEKKLELAVNITKKPVTFDDMIIPEPQTNLSTDGRKVKLFKEGQCEFGTFLYYLEGAEEEYYWTEKIPEVSAPGTYKIAWRFEGDNNHGDLGDVYHAFEYEVEVKAMPNSSSLPPWALALLIAIGLAAVVALTILTGKKVKKMNDEK